MDTPNACDEKKSEYSEKRDVPDSVKKDILRTILDIIIVDYSTVTDLFPTTPDINDVSQGYSLRFTLQVTSSNLWISPYSP
jgi:hypothetical protein